MEAYFNHSILYETAHRSLRDTYEYSSNFDSFYPYTRSDDEETDNNTDDDVVNVVTDVPGNDLCEKMSTLQNDFLTCVKNKNKDWLVNGKKILKKMFMYDRIEVLASLNDCHLFRSEHHSLKKAVRFLRMAAYFRGRIFENHKKSWLTFVATMVAKQHWDNEDFVIHAIRYYSHSFIFFCLKETKVNTKFLRKVLNLHQFSLRYCHFSC